MLSIQDYVTVAQRDYYEAMEFILLRKPDIDLLYDNAYFECKLNIQTRNQSKLSSIDTEEMINNMSYFLSKQTRFISDSAIVRNFLTDYSGEDKELVSRLEEYLFLSPTRFAVMYMLSDKCKHIDISVKSDAITVMLESFIGKNESEDLEIKRYLNDYHTFSDIKDNNEIIQKIKKELKCLQLS